jgi:hypothetical protein
MSAGCTLHWSPVGAPAGCAGPPVGCQLLALWPAPVNPDACFEEAGFTDFGDNDDAWDAASSALIDRLLAALAAHDAPRLLSPPLRQGRNWHRRLLAALRLGAGADAALPLKTQIEMPMQWDSLPRCQIAFGDRGVALHAGDGHVLFWVVLPGSDVRDAAAFVCLAAGALPVVQTALHWECLLPKARW